MNSLTADICARAVIASARAWGVDPVGVMTTRRMTHRSPLLAAAAALSSSLNVSVSTVVRVFGLGASSVYAARKDKSHAFRAAQGAAELAIKAALDAQPDRGGATVVPTPALKPRTPCAPSPLTETTLVELVLASMANGSMTTMGIAMLADRKELAVIGCVKQLVAEGRVIETPTLTGPRRFEYSLAPDAPAAPADPGPPIGQRICEVLACEPCTSFDLAEILDVPEPEVRAALPELERERKVYARPLTQEGWEARFWRLAGGER